VSTIVEAASVLLTRGREAEEVFLVDRAAALRFFGGFQAFPGGKVHSSDAELAGRTPGLTSRHVAAIRELFEETGVLLAHQADGTYPATDADLLAFRRDLLADQLAFRVLLERRGLHLRPEDLTPVGSLVTPPFVPVRFDTAFFVATMPAGQAAEIWPGELTAGFWRTADEALTRWTAGGDLLSPPTVSLLQAIRGCPVGALPERIRPLLESLEAGAVHPIWFSPAVQMIPLHTQGLPPSTHTNAYLVGTGPVYLLDPGPTDPNEQARLFAVLDGQRATRPLTAVVLTHHHPDHIGAAVACSTRYGVPVLAHPWTAEALKGQVEIRQFVQDDDTLDLGPVPDGAGRWHLQALHTPGHAPGHLVFFEPRYRLLFAGDMVSTLSSVIIAPPEGDLAVYLDSVRRLQTLPARLLLPAHGSPSSRPAHILHDCLAHRQERERQLLEVLQTGPRSIPDIAREMYRGLPAPLMRFAELQVLAGLQKLQREGRAVPTAPSSGQEWSGTTTR
jgi:ribonuclease/clavin/mitogillin